MKQVSLQQFHKLFITKVAAEDACSQQQLMRRPYVTSCSGRKCPGQGKTEMLLYIVEVRPTLQPLSAAYIRFWCNSGNVPLMIVQGNVTVNSKHVFGTQLLQITGYIK
jgi:hypothetical protein